MQLVNDIVAEKSKKIYTKALKELLQTCNEDLESDGAFDSGFYVLKIYSVNENQKMLFNL